ncbi:MAG TPA: TonB-dependent receptor [Thermoanaerobaculia bacterium]|nr:TonB-dependent receptor [Thermoanaerobaculia bacterium]
MTTPRITPELRCAAAGALRSAGRKMLLAAVLLLAAAPAAAEITGRVTTITGAPVPQARVELVGGAAGAALTGPAFTDATGAFVLPGAAAPADLLVTHPRYQAASVHVPAGAAAAVVLEAKQEVFEEIVVTAARGGDPVSPPSVAVASLDPRELPGAPASVVEAVTAVPGVAENGQGGLFQVYSIRGVSRQRVLTLLDGVPLTSERRAGVSASFLDPLLLGTAEVVRGPASSLYGSGALGGVVQLFPERRIGGVAEAGWSSQGDESYQRLGGGGAAPTGRTWSAALAHREAGDAETADGARLFSRFERWNGFARLGWGAEPRRWELLLVPALTSGIGKPNAEATRTSYPREEHLVAKLSLATAATAASLYLHPHTLETLAEEPGGGGARVDNRSLDLGADLQHQRAVGDDVAVRFGVEWVARRGVEAVERERDAAGAPGSAARTLDDAEEDDAGLYGSARWTKPRATFEVGGRLSWIRQSNGGAGSTEDRAWSGFAGAVVPLAAGFQATANLGTGLRFPSLSERYFSGTTGRGEVVANEDLEAERSLHGDLGLAWYGRRAFAAVHAFRQEIDDYVERVEIRPGVRTFVNLTSGTIHGVEAEGFLQPSAGWLLSWGGATIDGEATTGAPLADIPADRLFVALTADPPTWLGGRWTARLRAEHREARDEPGPGERAIPSAFLLSAALDYRLRPEVTLTLRGTNLADDLYWPSADDLALPGPGRGVGLGVRWEAK